MFPHAPTIYCQIYWVTHAFPFLQIFNQLVEMLHRCVVRYFLAVQSGGFFLDSVSDLLRFIFDVSFRGVFAKILFPSDIMRSIKSSIQLKWRWEMILFPLLIHWYETHLYFLIWGDSQNFDSQSLPCLSFYGFLELQPFQPLYLLPLW